MTVAPTVLSVKNSFTNNNEIKNNNHAFEYAAYIKNCSKPGITKDWKVIFNKGKANDGLF